MSLEQKTWSKMKDASQTERGKMAEGALLKYDQLKDSLFRMGRVLIAFSGGVDSTFLLKAAHEVLGEDVLAVFVSSEIYPEGEKEEAVKLAEKMNVRYKVVQTRELDNPDFVSNSPQRCYYCKRELFSMLKEVARKERIPYILDGSNFEDRKDFRPGKRAAEEFGIRSPLREVRLVKREIRQLSKKFGLPTWNKPSLACLASRFPYYTRIERMNLTKVARAEGALKKLGLRQVRVRHHGQIARIEIEPADFQKVIRKELRNKIVSQLKKFGYFYITLDLAGYRTGSMNEPLSRKEKRSKK